MEIDKIITMLMVVTMAVTMKWRENLLPTCYDHSEMNTNVIFKNMLFRTKWKQKKKGEAVKKWERKQLSTSYISNDEQD